MMNINRNPFTAARRLFSRLRFCRRAAAAVEFALLVPVVLAGLTGVVNYGLAMSDKMALQSAARAGAQLALIDSSDTAAISNAVVASTNLNISTSDVTTTQFCECWDGDSSTAVESLSACTDSCSSGTKRYFMTVSVSENFTLLLLGTTITLNGSAVVRTQ